MIEVGLCAERERERETGQGEKGGDEEGGGSVCLGPNGKAGVQ